jgi:antitoxin (DNA-binding transcriptional repressor) of toxin-antitoxin stability system
MQCYNYSEARQNLAAVLDWALTETVMITRRDGSCFKVTSVAPTKKKKSPLDIPGIKTDITMAEIVAAVREGRERHEANPHVSR